MRYTIWDKISNIVTPVGENLTPNEWIAKHPIAGVEGIKTVCSGGVVNGGVFAIYDNFKQMYEDMGCDFSDCTTEQECLNKIEQFENDMNKPSDEPTAEERIASALEFQNILALPDEEEEGV